MQIHTDVISVRTDKRCDMVDISSRVRDIISKSGIKDGDCVVFCRHTTAGITINENADPDVVHDILLTLEELVPHRRAGYRHAEGNSDSHVKSTLTGASEHILISDGKPVLGTWQGIYFCEYDGPRSRKVQVQVKGE